MRRVGFQLKAQAERAERDMHSCRVEAPCKRIWSSSKSPSTSVSSSLSTWCPCLCRRRAEQEAWQRDRAQDQQRIAELTAQCCACELRLAEMKEQCEAAQVSSFVPQG